MLDLLLTILAVIALLAIISPMFRSETTVLAASAAINDIEKLTALKQEILDRYLNDEQAWQTKQLSPRAWRNRRAFLVNRYLDVCRRLDHLDSKRK